MNVTGPTEFIASLQAAERAAHEQAITRRIARLLIHYHRIPETYPDLVMDPFAATRPTLTEAVCQWLNAQSAATGQSLKEIGMPELQQRFNSHLWEVFDEFPCCP